MDHMFQCIGGLGFWLGLAGMFVCFARVGVEVWTALCWFFLAGFGACVLVSGSR